MKIQIFINLLNYRKKEQVEGAALACCPITRTQLLASHVFVQIPRVQRHKAPAARMTQIW